MFYYIFYCPFPISLLAVEFIYSIFGGISIKFDYQEIAAVYQ